MKSRLLYLNLAIDSQDTSLGFAIGWLKEVSKIYDKVDVITLRKGTVPNLPDNVNIYGEVLKNAGNKTLLVVQKGDALWKIAYQRLGGGQKYIDIINLNKDKINDPDLIFPKQLFILP